MLKNSPFWNAYNSVQLCSCCVPIMLMQQVSQLENAEHCGGEPEQAANMTTHEQQLIWLHMTRLLKLHAEIMS